jgi:uncharacterized protein YkwD
MMNFLKHLFVPHHGNQHRPHILRTPVVKTFLALTIMVEALFLLRSAGLLPDLQNFAAVLASAMVIETNIDRTTQHLPELTINPLLEEAARQKAKDMAEKGYFSHIGPEGEQPWVWLRKVGYYYFSAGENLAINFTDSKDVTDAWMNSPLHRANILSNNFTEVGIGTAVGMYKGKETTFVVQFFGKPYVAPTATPEDKLAIEDLPAKNTPAAPAQKPITKATPARNVPITPATTSDDLPVTQPPVPAPMLLTQEPDLPEGSSTQVLGTQTKVIEGNVTAHLSFWQRMAANPRSAAFFVVTLLETLVAVGLFITLMIRKQSSHRDIVMNGLAFLAVALIVVAANQYFSTKDILLS